MMPVPISCLIIKNLWQTYDKSCKMVFHTHTNVLYNISISLAILEFQYCVLGLRVTVHTPLSREVFWHEYAKIPRHTSQNSIAAGNLE